MRRHRGGTPRLPAYDVLLSCSQPVAQTCQRRELLPPGLPHSGTALLCNTAFLTLCSFLNNDELTFISAAPSNPATIVGFIITNGYRAPGSQVVQNGRTLTLYEATTSYATTTLQTCTDGFLSPLPVNNGKCWDGTYQLNVTLVGGWVGGWVGGRAGGRAGRRAGVRVGERACNRGGVA